MNPSNSGAMDLVRLEKAVLTYIPSSSVTTRCGVVSMNLADAKPRRPSKARTKRMVLK